MCECLYGLSTADRQKINGVLETYQAVDQAILYGSRAKGNYKPGSDIDLTIIGDLDWASFTTLERELDDLLLPYQIDLSIYRQIDNPALIAHVERVGQVFYQNDRLKQP